MKRILLLYMLVCPVLLFSQRKDIEPLANEDEKLLKYIVMISSKPGKDLPAITENVLIPAKSTLDSFKLVYLWVTHNIAYNTRVYDGMPIKPVTPGETLKSKVAVCSGYTGLFQEMCRLAGLTCLYVNGYSKGFGYKQGTPFKTTDHAWNLVYLDGKWHPVDATWGAGYVQYIDRKVVFVKKLNMFYFLSPPEEFIGRHLPAAPMFQLMKNIVSMKVYVNSDGAEEMISKASDEVYDFKDSISYYLSLPEEERDIWLAEQEYRFHSTDARNLAVKYYNYAVNTSKISNTDKALLLKSLHYYEKAEILIKSSNMDNKLELLDGIGQGRKYVQFYLDRLE